MEHTSQYQVSRWKFEKPNSRIGETCRADARRDWGLDMDIHAANASIKPEQVSIEGLARHAVWLHAQQAGSVSLVLTTC
ncbi:hypothetical protein [Polaromonas sp. OV174]|uniref:hypothetical protein n=1 Tax=Polaromonas sp. OV174 TaxID=1855300 RepID=UPI0011602E1E|nr:hypothetical protein [Polaromonas sp. OV174]